MKTYKQWLQGLKKDDIIIVNNIKKYKEYEKLKVASVGANIEDVNGRRYSKETGHCMDVNRIEYKLEYPSEELLEDVEREDLIDLLYSEKYRELPTETLRKLAEIIR